MIYTDKAQTFPSIMDYRRINIARITTSDAQFEDSLDLMHKSFADDELRLDEDLRAITEGNTLFSFNIIKDESGNRIGLITTWNFGKCLYVEHFAIEPELRGREYGSATLAKLSEISNLPIILEVELPETSSEASRRVKFYERSGFCGWQTPYIQPPYSAGKNPVPMMIMSKGLDETIECAGIVTALLHRHVYGVKHNMRQSN